MTMLDTPTPALIWQAILAVNAAVRSAPSGRDGLSVVADALGGVATRHGRWPGALIHVGADGLWSAEATLPPAAAQLCDLYLPLCAAAAGRRYVVAHLGQSLDGRIATRCGASQWVTGEEDIIHNHRMRALADAVVVGAGTVRHDDPRLTVRRCAGHNPVRIVIDTNRRLDGRFGLFRDGAAPTLLLCAQDVGTEASLGDAEIVGLPRRGNGLLPEAVLDLLARRGLGFVFIEGGGITVSRFLEADALDRLQVTVAPLIIGSGRPSFTLPEVDTIAGGLRPPARRIPLGGDIMFDCILHG